MFFDIEVDFDPERGYASTDDPFMPVTAISCYMSWTDQLVTLAVPPKTLTMQQAKDQTKEWGEECVLFEKEGDMLQAFLDLIEDSDIITGWNVNSFDMHYLVNRIAKILGDSEMKRLSPWRKVDKVSTVIRGQNTTQIKLCGVNIIDYLDLYRKFTYVTQESYRLDHIGFVELGKKKLDHSEFSAMHLFYKNNYQKYIDYNIVDVELVDKLDDKLKLLDLLITIAYSAKINFEEVMSPIRTWDSVSYTHLTLPTTPYV